MSVRRSGGGPPNPQGEQLRARNAAGKLAREAPKVRVGYLRPHRVHSEAEERIAEQRHHQQAMEEEAHRLAHLNRDDGLSQSQKELEEKNDTKLKGINWDDKRNKKGRKDGGDKDDRPENPDAEEAMKSLGLGDGNAKYFQDAEDRMGDPSLLDAEEIKRVLGPSVRFAQHVMLLADERMKEGMPREEAIRYMAGLFQSLADRSYANKALREFGAATGILDIYPLEVIKHLLEHVPGMVAKVETGSLFVNTPVQGYEGVTHEPIALSYDPDLRVRGFAVKGGGKPGYLFEPVDPPGTYHLTFYTAGTYQVIVSALGKNGVLKIDEFPVVITPGADVSDTDAQARAKAQYVAESGGEETPKDPDAEPKKKDKDLKVVIPRRI